MTADVNNWRDRDHNGGRAALGVHRRTGRNELVGHGNMTADAGICITLVIIEWLP